MSVLDWFFTSFFIILYIFLLFTVCFLTFRKGYLALGIIGILDRKSTRLNSSH